VIVKKMIMEKQMECRLVGETEVLGEDLPQTAATYWPIVPASIDSEDDCGEVDGM
jgi:hypothetical protein